MGQCCSYTAIQAGDRKRLHIGQTFSSAISFDKQANKSFPPSWTLFHEKLSALSSPCSKTHTPNPWAISGERSHCWLCLSRQSSGCGPAGSGTIANLVTGCQHPRSSSTIARRWVREHTLFVSLAPETGNAIFRARVGLLIDRSS